MGATGATKNGMRRFCLVLVKPSHYDDAGYVIQWMRSPIPSNSLASLYGLAKDCAERRILGDDVEIEIHAFDETNSRIYPGRLAAMIEAAGSGMVMLTGVQSNQFPRALDLAKPLRRVASRSVLAVPCVGCFHARRRRDADLDRAKAMGGSCSQARQKAASTTVLRDAAAGTCPPLYNHMNDLPSIEGTPIPLMAVERAGGLPAAPPASMQAAAVPISVSFCTIINVQGANRAASLTMLSTLFG